jgi:hypothetical protein
MREEEQLVDIEGEKDDGGLPALDHTASSSASLAPPTATSARQSVSRPHSEHATPAPGTPVPPATAAAASGGGASVNGSGAFGGETVDDDIAWADEDPDDDLPGWKFKIVMEDDRDFM